MEFLIGDRVHVVEHHGIDGAEYRAFDGVIIDFNQPTIAVVKYTNPNGMCYRVECANLVLVERLTVEQMLTHRESAVRSSARRHGERYIPIDQFIQRILVR